MEKMMAEQAEYLNDKEEVSNEREIMGQD